MDSIGMHIRKHLGPDGKVEVVMNGLTKPVRLQPIDAREAIESRRGKIAGPALNYVPHDLTPIKPEMSEDEIVAHLEESRPAIQASNKGSK